MSYQITIRVTGEEDKKNVLKAILPGMDIQMEGDIIVREENCFEKTKVIMEALAKMSPVQEETEEKPDENKERSGNPVKKNSAKEGSRQQKVKVVKRKKSSRGDEILRLMQENPEKEYRVKDLSEKLGCSYAAVSSAMYKLSQEGLVTRTDKAYKLVEAVESTVPVVTEAEAQEVSGTTKEVKPEISGTTKEVKTDKNVGESEERSQTAATEAVQIPEETPKISKTVKKQAVPVKFEKIRKCFGEEKYKDILMFLFPKKATFTIDKLNNSFQTKEKEITELIQLFIDEVFIPNKGMKGRYTISSKWRIYAYLLKAGKMVEEGTIKYDLGISEKDLYSETEKAIEEGLMRKKEVRDRMVYGVR